MIMRSQSPSRRRIGYGGGGNKGPGSLGMPGAQPTNSWQGAGAAQPAPIRPPGPSFSQPPNQSANGHSAPVRPSGGYRPVSQPQQTGYVPPQAPRPINQPAQHQMSAKDQSRSRPKQPAGPRSSGTTASGNYRPTGGGRPMGAHTGMASGDQNNFSYGTGGGYGVAPGGGAFMTPSYGGFVGGLSGTDYVNHMGNQMGLAGSYYNSLGGVQEAQINAGSNNYISDNQTGLGIYQINQNASMAADLNQTNLDIAAGDQAQQAYATTYGNQTAQMGHQLGFEASNYAADQGLAGVGLQAGASNYAADQNLAGQHVQAGAMNYAADQGLAGTQLQTAADMYGADLGLAGVMAQADSANYGYDQQLAGIGMQTGAANYATDAQLQSDFGQQATDRYGFDVGAQQALGTAGIQAGAQMYGADANRDVGLAGVGAQNFATATGAATDRMGLDNEMTRFNAQQANLSQLMNNLDSFGPSGGGGQAVDPQITAGEVFSDSQERALINNAISNNARERGAQDLAVNESGGAQGWAGGAAMAAMKNQNRIQEGIANTRAITDTPINLAGQNAQHLLQSQVAQEQQRAALADEETRRRQVYASMFSPLVGAMAQY